MEYKIEIEIENPIVVKKLKSLNGNFEYNQKLENFMGILLSHLSKLDYHDLTVGQNKYYDFMIGIYSIEMKVRSDGDIIDIKSLFKSSSDFYFTISPHYTPGLMKGRIYSTRELKCYVIDNNLENEEYFKIRYKTIYHIWIGDWKIVDTNPLAFDLNSFINNSKLNLEKKLKHLYKKGLGWN